MHAEVCECMQSLQQIITDLQSMAEAEDEALPESAVNTLTELTGGKRALRSDSDLQHSQPPITVTPFWGPGLAAATSQSTSMAPSSTPASPQLHPRQGASASNANPAPASSTPPSNANTSTPVEVRPRPYSRDGNLSTSRDTSRDSSMHGGNNLWQFSSGLTQAVLRSMFYKRLCWLLGAGPAELSLIAKAVQASSTGTNTFFMRIKTPLSSTGAGAHITLNFSASIQAVQLTPPSTASYAQTLCLHV